MLLEDRAIIERLLDKELKQRIIITPLIDPVKQIGPSSVDVRLGGNFTVPTTSRLGSIDPDRGLVKGYTSAGRYRSQRSIFPAPRRIPS